MTPKIDIEIFKEFDVRVQAGKERYFCLLDPCREKEFSSVNHRCWKLHRQRVHHLPNDADSSVPTRWMVKGWVQNGKPIPYELPPKRRRPGFAKPDSPEAADPLELEKMQPASADSNVFFQFDVTEDVRTGKPHYWCLLPSCAELGIFLSRRQNLQLHRRDVHRSLQLEELPLGHAINQWRKLGKPRPYTSLEVDLENPRTITPPSLTPAGLPVDEAGPSNVLPAPAPKKKGSCRAASPAIPAPSVAETAEDPRDGAASEEEDFRSLLNIPDDETASSEYYDPGYHDYRAKDEIDEYQMVDQMPEHQDYQHSMAEFGVEALEEFADRQDQLVPQRPSIQYEARKGTSDVEVSSEDLSVAQAGALLMSMAEDEMPLCLPGFSGGLP